MSSYGLDDDVALANLDQSVLGMLEKLRVKEPNLLHPYEGFRPNVHPDDLEFNQRWEAALSLIREDIGPVEELQKRNGDAMRLLGERMRNLTSQSVSSRTETDD
jgi:hypothetical protein